MRRSPRGFAIVLSALCLVVAACGPGESQSTAEAPSTSGTETPPTSASGSTTSTGAEELTEVTWRTGFGCNSWDAPYYLAKELGFYEEAGLDVTIGCGEGSSSNVQLIATKSDTFAHVASSVLAPAIAEGANVRMVANFLQSAGDGIVTEPGIESVDQMAGKTFAGSEFSYVTRLISPTFEEAVGLEVGSINIQSTNAQVQLFVVGEVDMIPGQGWAEVPLLETQGVDFNFFPMADYGLDLIGPGITTHVDTLQEDPEMVANFAAASARGWQYAYDNPEEATDIMVELLPDIDEAVHRATIESLMAHAHRPATEGKNLGWMAESDWEDVVDLMVQLGILDGPLETDRLFTNVLPENP